MPSPKVANSIPRKDQNVVGRSLVCGNVVPAVFTVGVIGACFRAVVTCAACAVDVVVVPSACWVAVVAAVNVTS